ncbi:MAG TPA: phosphocholine cytidylyltransferase family protein [Magnetospirillum sp.]|nr:phosphocholine cytidylyltransferase family protein [Magnetospirillum sp.]
MRALILAAGRGSRMLALTEDRPKGLVELAGRPLLEYQLRALRAGGATEIGIVTGYRGQQLSPYADRLFDNPRWQETNMVRSLACAHDWLAEAPCLVSYADIVVSARTVADLTAAQGDIAISFDPDWQALWSARFADPLSDAETFQRDGAGRLTGIGARPQSIEQVQGQYMGLLRFTPDGWAQVSARLNGPLAPRFDKLDMTSLLSDLLAAGHDIATVPATGQWIEADSGDDLVLYEQMLADGRLVLE